MAIKIKEKVIILALINLGIFSLIAQVLLIRELVISFYGNELFVSLILAGWLISTGVGSFGAGKIFKSGQKNLLLGWHLFIPLVFLGAFVLARLARAVLAGGGVMPDLIWATFWSLLVIAPLGLLLGAQFVFLVGQLKPGQSQAVSLAYIIESFGFFLGAGLFNLVLFQLTSLTVICLLAIISFIIALLLSFRCLEAKFNLNISLAIAALIILAAGGLIKTDFWDKELNKWHYPGEDLLASTNSKYGTIEITQIGEQINFYYNGQLADNSQNKYHNELMVHLPMLVASAPQNILVIGNAFTGITTELKKYKPEKIVYLELDKVYYELAGSLGFTAGAEVINQDARHYLDKTPEKFDVVIINYANPATLAANRYFTKEFFALINSCLMKQGIVAVKLDTTPNYMVGAQNELLTIFYQTLKEVYNHVWTLPDNEVVFLASNQQPVIDFKRIREKYLALNLDNKYVIPDFITWRFTNDRVISLNKQLPADNWQVNSYLKPTLYYQQLKIFLEKMGWVVNKVCWWLMMLGAGGILYLLYKISWQANDKRQENFLLIASVIPEFCLMSFEVMLILLFQAWHGYLYTQLSLIIALVLLGISLGSLIFRKLLVRIEATKLIKLSYLIIIAAFFLPLLLVWQFSFVFNYKIIYWLLSILSGLAIGTKFPVINKIYLKNNTNLGAIYGIDLIGGAVGALAAGIFILPVLGVIGGLGLMVGLCLVGLIIISFKLT